MWCCIYFHIECYAMVCFRLSGQHNTAPQRVLGVPELVCCHLVRLQRAIDCFHNIQMVRRQRGSPGFRWLLPPLLHRRLSHCVLWGFIPRQQLRFMQPQYIGASLCWRYKYLLAHFQIFLMSHRLSVPRVSQRQLHIFHSCDANCTRYLQKAGQMFWHNCQTTARNTFWYNAKILYILQHTLAITGHDTHTHTHTRSWEN